jgi:hypothetical protein
MIRGGWEGQGSRYYYPLATFIPLTDSERDVFQVIARRFKAEIVLWLPRWVFWHTVMGICEASWHFEMPLTDFGEFPL